jgi:hypothetical protein
MLLDSSECPISLFSSMLLGKRNKEKQIKGETDFAEQARQ